MKTRALLSSVTIALTVLLPGTFAAAQDGADPYVAPSPTVSGATTVPPSAEPAAPTDVASNELVLDNAASNEAATNEVASSNLAFTGGDVAALAGVGLLAIALGFAMVILRNRNRGADTVA